MNNIEEFITNVYNYYNGKINIENTSTILKICYTISKKENRAAYTRACGVITIMPNRIQSISYNDNELKLNIIESIIHELYHVDQLILYSRTLVDKNYLQLIEDTVEFMVLSYILNNESEILNVFGVTIPISVKEYMIKRMNITIPQRTQVMYYRGYMGDFICSAIDAITLDYNFNNNLINCLMYAMAIDHPFHISVIINNNEFIIRDRNGYICELSDFNEFMRLNYFNDEIHDIYEFKITGNTDDELNIIVTCKGYLRLGTIL